MPLTSNSVHSPNPFDRSGLAALSDFETPGWKELFGFLEKEQAEFLAKESAFRSSQYKWPRDPLHTWSRVWEYPYVYYHLKRLRDRHNTPELLRVVDFGSGVTFFPFSVARLSCHVTCTDIDPVCGVDLPRAAQVVGPAPGVVDFKLCEGGTLPFSPGDADALYCISVLEHIPQAARLVAEFARVLKPGGLLVLTVDVDLRGDGEIGPDGHKALTAALDRHFSFLCPEKTIHPQDLLTTATGPCAQKPLNPVAHLSFILKRQARQLLRQKPAFLYPRLPYLLAIQSFVMTKKLTVEQALARCTTALS